MDKCDNIIFDIQAMSYVNVYHAQDECACACVCILHIMKNVLVCINFVHIQTLAN